MAVQVKPHTARLLSGEADAGDGNAVQVADFAGHPARTIQGRFAPLTPEVAFSRVGAEVQEPHRFICEVADGERFAIGDRVVWQGRGKRFVVKHRQIFDTNPVTAHADITLELLTTEAE